MARSDSLPRFAVTRAPLAALLLSACAVTASPGSEGSPPDAGGLAEAGAVDPGSVPARSRGNTVRGVDAGTSEPCNGLVSNCGRTYDRVTIAATHNAFAYASGGPVNYLLPNQDRPIPEQLAAGMRGLGLRPCPYFGSDPREQDRVYVTHNSDLQGALGTEPLDGILADIRSFLDAHPREVVSLYMESTVTPAELASTFENAGLGPYLFALDPTEGWPALDAMIASGRRLVAFNDSQDPSRPPWMLYLYDQIVDTDYEAWGPPDFTCAFYRGSASNPIYYLNHFLDLPLPSSASIVNAPDFILERAHQCLNETGRRASVVYVDMFLEGDAVGAVDALNLESAGDADP